MEGMKFIGRPTVRALTIIAASIGVISVSGTWTAAQTTGFYASDTPEVTVDMSVLEDIGSAAGVKGVPPRPGVGGHLLIPGPQAPVSRLYVKPQGGKATMPPPTKNRIALTPPRTGPALPPSQPPVSAMNVPGKSVPPAPAPEAKPATPKRLAKAPKAAPVKPSVASTAPPPPTIEKPQAAPAAPAPAPASAPPAPAVEKPQVAKAPQASNMTAPPPPPAPSGAEASTVATAEPPAKEQASLPKAETPAVPGQAMHIVFEAGGSKLTDQARTELKALLQGMLNKPELRLQLLAYAGGESLSSSKARRLSLSRALAVRSYLIENGLRSTRIDVRALGNKTTEEPVNRVDVNVVER